eukprot:NODE_6850_length_1632_cov_5.124917.p1 GENE.NODE_6850_length_1632_cov_5.124917~~NODE_6850_length_1632_cov_5.124917.p1  ORF type:complete len:343 (+),score=115.69 NODE_6850_length_1632_cov_5.124917:182-1210(+)
MYVPLAERLEAVSQLAQTDRGARDMTKQSLEQHVGVVRDNLESERKLRQRETRATADLLQEYRRTVTEETEARIALEDAHSNDMSGLNDRIENALRVNGDHLLKLGEEIRQVAAGSSMEIQSHAREVNQVRAATELCQVDVVSARERLEERMLQLEGKFHELKRKGCFQIQQSLPSLFDDSPAGDGDGGGGAAASNANIAKITQACVGSPELQRLLLRTIVDWQEAEAQAQAQPQAQPQSPQHVRPTPSFMTPASLMAPMSPTSLRPQAQLPAAAVTFNVVPVPGSASYSVSGSPVTSSNRSPVSSPSRRMAVPLGSLNHQQLQQHQQQQPRTNLSSVTSLR